MTDDNRTMIAWDDDGNIIHVEASTYLAAPTRLRWLVDHDGDKTLQQSFQTSAGRIWLPIPEISWRQKYDLHDGKKKKQTPNKYYGWPEGWPS